MIGVMGASLLTGCGGTNGTDDSQQTMQENSQVNAETEAEVEYPTGELLTPAESFAGGDGTKENPYEISTAEELYRMASIINGSELGANESYYVLTNDIVINDVSNYENWGKEAPRYGWEPIKFFKGNFNGNGYGITGLYCFIAGEKNLANGGFFNNIEGGTVENVIMDKAMVIQKVSGNYAGILAGSMSYGEIRNCQTEGLVTGYRAGGVLGHAYWSVVDNCSFSGEVRGENGGYCGGIIGSVSGAAVANCSNMGTIISTEEKDSTAGGIVGTFSATAMGFSLDEETYPEMAAAAEEFISYVRSKGVGIKNSINKGNVQVKEGCAGGITGDISDGLGHQYRDVAVIDGCVNEGIISSEGTAVCSIGGICGWYATSPATMEDMVVIGGVKFENCINSGSVVSVGANAGGILGGANMEKGTLVFDNCTSTGPIKAELEEIGGFNTVAGGIAGTVSVFEGEEIRVENCLVESEMRTKKAAFVGGMVGSITVATSNDSELTCILNNCQSNGEFIVDEKATCGFVCASFMEGVQKDDFAGNVEVKNCTSTSDIPEFGTEGNIIGYLEKAYIEAWENEKKQEAGE